MTFAPHHAIVAASDTGIGRTTAVALAASGLDVGVTWHTDEDGALDKAAEVRDAGGKAEVARLDTADLASQEDQDPQQNARPGVPLGRPGHAWEIAAASAFLASPQEPYVTGANWPVDGGMLQSGPRPGHTSPPASGEPPDPTDTLSAHADLGCVV